MPAPTPAPLCSVYSTYSPVEAHIVSGTLEDAGIECVLSSEFFAADAEQEKELFRAARPTAD